MSSWTIRQRLVAGFLSVAVIALGIGGLGIYAARSAEASLVEIGGVRLPSVEALKTIEIAQVEVDSAENALLSRTLTTDQRRALHARFAAARAMAEEARKVYEPLPQTPEEAETWKAFVPAWDAWWRDHEHYVELEMAYEEQPSDARYSALSEFAIVTIAATFERADSLLEKLVKINSTVGHEEVAAATAQAAWVRTATVVATLGGVLLAVALGLVISVGLNRILSTRVQELSEGASQVSAAADQVSTAAQSLSQGATEQAASLEETSASMEEMSSIVKQNANSASEAARLMTEVGQQVAQANRVLADTVGSMQAIRTSSDRVTKIVKTIDEIAFQTNILALNAAVEAARAGEAGMGFAVVADEVRNLAQRAATAARETSSLIEESSQNAALGGTQVEAVAQAIAAVTASIGRVQAIAQEVDIASQQQAQGVQQMATAISQMEKVTQGTAATAEESAAASEELSAQSATTMEIVGRLGELVGGTHRTGTAPLTPVRPRFAAQSKRPLAIVQTSPPAGTSSMANDPIIELFG